VYHHAFDESCSTAKGSHAARYETARLPSTTTTASHSRTRRFSPAVSHARSCAILRPASSVCASPGTRTMSPARSRRAADVAPSARRRTRPPSRTASVESSRSRKEQESQYMRAWDASSYTSGSMTAWESENDTPIADLMEDIIHALGRLERRDNGKRREGRSAISV
jgi:hypothetical protein